MNERIRKLVIEATKQVNDDLLKEDEAKCIWLAKWFSDLPMDQEKFQEKFAELIIKECIDICEKDGRWWADQGYLMEAGEAGSLATQIKEHFGVK